MSSRRSELKKNIDIFDTNHHTLLPKIISVSTFFWRNQTRSQDTFKMLIWTFFTESDWMHSLSTRSRLWRLVHFLLHFCAYWSISFLMHIWHVIYIHVLVCIIENSTMQQYYISVKKIVILLLNVRLCKYTCIITIFSSSSK